jgi:hypothetical protein
MAAVAIVSWALAQRPYYSTIVTKNEFQSSELPNETIYMVEGTTIQYVLNRRLFWFSVVLFIFMVLSTARGFYLAFRGPKVTDVLSVPPKRRRAVRNGLWLILVPLVAILSLVLLRIAWIILIVNPNSTPHHGEMLLMNLLQWVTLGICGGATIAGIAILFSEYRRRSARAMSDTTA